jgi:hypothetical protein
MITEQGKSPEALGFSTMTSTEALHHSQLTDSELREEAEFAGLWQEEQELNWLEADGELPNFGLEEYRLFHNFPDLVYDIDFAEIIQAVGGTEKAIANSHHYGLLGIEALNYIHSSKEPRGSKAPLILPNDVDYPFGKPHLDAGFGIGLTYKDNLCAISSAYITDEGNLRIVQLQGSPKPGNRNNRGKSGLYGGFKWRDALVLAWIDVARGLGADKIEIQSAYNYPLVDEHYEPEVFERFLAIYDKVAMHMGFKQNLERDWELDLTKD